MDTLPDWLSPPTDELPKFPRTREHRELEKLTFEAMFERVLDGIVEGQSAKSIVENDPRGIQYGRFYQWIKRDPERLARYEDAQEASAEVLMEESQQIADGDPNLPPEEVQRSILRINVRKFRIQSYNRKRYGDKQQVDLNSNHQISIVSALEEARSRMRTIDVTPTLIEGENK